MGTVTNSGINHMEWELLKLNAYNDDYSSDQLYPGINIAAAIVSPITNEILFVDVQNRIVRAIEYDTVPIALEFITPEDMEIIEYLLELQAVEDNEGYPVVVDNNGDIFYLVSLDNGIAFSSAHFITHGEIMDINNISNNNSVSYFSITAIIAIIVVFLIIFKLNRSREKN